MNKKGSNDNPSCRAFNAIDSSLLVRSEIKGFDVENALALSNMTMTRYSPGIVTNPKSSLNNDFQNEIRG